MKITEMVVLCCFSVLFYYESSLIEVSITKLTVYTLDGLVLDLCFPNMDLYVCDFEICNIGLQIII